MKTLTIFSTIVLFWVAALFSTAQAQNLAICQGEYALCAASPATPTGNSIVVGNKVFKEGMAVCPVLDGGSIANLDLMGGSCTAAKGKVWSLFGFPPVSSYPQAPDWTVQPAVARTFVTTATSGMSNMWSFECVKTKKVNGVQLADCFGPLNESPFDGGHVKAGSTVVTQAPVGASFPVGGNLP